MSTGEYSIFLAEDNEGIREALTDALVSRGYKVLVARDGDEAMVMVRAHAFDLALLDVAMPGKDGFEVLSSIVRDRPGTPVLMLTAKGDIEDRVRGLTLGADDYIVKPFDLRELLARIQAVLRRSPERPRADLPTELCGALLNHETHVLTFIGGSESQLTSKEYDLLAYFMAHPNRVISRDELLRRVWSIDPKATDTHSVEVTMKRLRTKLGSDASVCLETLRGSGYRWRS